MHLMEMSSAPHPTVPTVPVRDLTDGQDVDFVLLVRSVELRRTRDGAPYLRLSLGDRTGRLSAVVRDPVPELQELCGAGRPVRVAGRYEVHERWGAQLAIRALGAPAPGTFDPSTL